LVEGIVVVKGCLYLWKVAENLLVGSNAASLCNIGSFNLVNGPMGCMKALFEWASESKCINKKNIF